MTLQAVKEFFAMVQVTSRQLLMVPDKIMCEIVVFNFHNLFLSIVSYTILTQLSSACCLELDPSIIYQLRHPDQGTLALLVLVLRCYLAVTAYVQGNASGRFGRLL